MIVSWWSGGVTSAVACKLALIKYSNVDLVFIETGSHHADMQRFKKDCEKWYKKQIITIQTEKFTDHFDVIERLKFINSPFGAPCTTQLKKRVRENFEKRNKIDGYVWGFEIGEKEENRAFRVQESNQNFKHYFPLIDHKITKKKAIKILSKYNIKPPKMYELGYHNNNCIGCPKGGMAYWNKIKIDFPDLFIKMANLERKIGHSCIKGIFLDELKPTQGRKLPPLIADCGSVGEGCEIQLSMEFHRNEALR
jgi:3'-phosphoadenosine 5'-phosphosulfate sulfotransferase (PAPS reductase)/FAD synthetase